MRHESTRVARRHVIASLWDRSQCFLPPVLMPLCSLFPQRIGLACETNRISENGSVIPNKDTMAFALLALGPVTLGKSTLHTTKTLK